MIFEICKVDAFNALPKLILCVYAYDVYFSYSWFAISRTFLYARTSLASSCENWYTMVKIIMFINIQIYSKIPNPDKQSPDLICKMSRKLNNFTQCLFDWWNIGYNNERHVILKYSRLVHDWIYLIKDNHISRHLYYPKNT